MASIHKILVANRGEIALRVMRTCKEMGIQTVAVYSEPDRDSLHVSYADEAYCIGPAAAKESYLRIDRLIDVALSAKADAIHPGYGFLSENPAFVEAALAAGLIFIGPPASAMEAMGSKTRSRQVMQAAGVPVVPGLLDAVSDPQMALEYAHKIGFPVMLKAAFGGGGKGMRKVDKAEAFISAYEAACSEAQNAFGDGAVYIEKYLVKPRHIEIQIFADTQGHIVSFAERECSAQRRHQKVIEESPSPFVTPDMRASMGQVARQAASAVGYVGAGTVEFLADADRHFYFMEMNTRLQVEHPITEMITGLDLVEWQIRVARGEPLCLIDKQIPHQGWAMEARICAEDPASMFMPSPGVVSNISWPAGPYVRIDSALTAGSEVTMNYDPMIAKVVAWGKDREAARHRLSRALNELDIRGCITNRYFVGQLLEDARFVSGEYDTSIIEQHVREQKPAVLDEQAQTALMAAAIYQLKQAKTRQTSEVTQAQTSLWPKVEPEFLVGV